MTKRLFILLVFTPLSVLLLLALGGLASYPIMAFLEGRFFNPLYPDITFGMRIIWLLLSCIFASLLLKALIDEE